MCVRAELLTRWWQSCSHPSWSSDPGRPYPRLPHCNHTDLAPPSHLTNHTHTHHTHTHTHIRLTALFPRLPRWAGTRKVEPIWILLKQETVSGSGISWARCKSAPSSRQITTPASHHSVFYRPDALPAAQPTASKHTHHNIVYHLLL